ncbi:hypothetical protein Golax_024714, partial [Gossypium laxum]|nr:hypothetical protein [Gossypium laxum]
KNQNDFIFNNASGNSYELFSSAEAWTRSLNIKTGTPSWDISTSWRKRWHFLDTGWTKINVDGLVSMSQSRVAIGGVIKGPQGGWLVGFGMVISFRLAVKLRLLSRDGNRVTNYLAKESLGSLNQLVILDEPLIYVRHLLEIDIYHAMSDIIDEN